MLTHGALHRLAIDRPPVSRAYEFREPMARHQLDKSKAIVNDEGDFLKSVIDKISRLYNPSGICIFPRSDALLA